MYLKMANPRSLTSSFALLISLMGQVCAQQPSKPIANTSARVSLSKVQLRSFDTALSVLSSQAGVTFVAEDFPSHSVLPDKDIPDISNLGSLDAEVDKIASAYDYDVARQKNVFILTKRYTDPKDLPYVTMGECIIALRGVKQITALFDPQIPQNKYVALPAGARDPLSGDFSASLNLAQLQAMQSQSLRVSSLKPVQQRLVKRFALYFYVQQPVDVADQALSWLDQADKEAVFQHGTLGVLTHLFGFEMPEGPQKHRYFEPLSGPYCTQSNFGATSIYNKYQPFLSTPDPTATDADISAHVTTGKTTIADVIALLNTRHEKNVHVTADSSLSSKPVTVIGMEYAMSPQLLNALASVYGLRVDVKQVGSDQNLSLTTVSPNLPANIDALPSALRSLFPKPFLDALHTDQTLALDVHLRQLVALSYALNPPNNSKGQSQANKEGLEESLSGLKEAMQKRKDAVYSREEWHEANSQIKEVEARPLAIRIAAIKKLRALVEPKLDKSDQGRVALSSIGEPEYDAFATVITSECFASLEAVMGHPVPDYVAHFNDLVLTGNVHKDSRGKQKFSMFLAVPTPDGSHLLQQVGVGNVTTPPRERGGFSVNAEPIGLR